MATLFGFLSLLLCVIAIHLAYLENWIALTCIPAMLYYAWMSARCIREGRKNSDEFLRMRQEFLELIGS